MNIKYMQIAVLFILICSCSSTVETEFGKTCGITAFKYVKKSFSSNLEGQIKFQLDENKQKNSGKMITGVLPGIIKGSHSLTLIDETNENCKDCIFMFIRDKVKGNRSYKAVSGIINVESLYYDTKGRVTFAKGHFSRMVFENIEEKQCVVVAKIDFVFY